MYIRSTLPLPNLTYKDERKKAIQISFDLHEEKINNSQALKRVEEAFSDYSHKEGWVASLAQFVGKTVGLKNIEIVPVDIEAGWSGDNTYWVRDLNTKEVKLFLKTFQADSKNYLPEIYGLKTLRKVKQLATPKIQALGKCYLEKTCYFLIGEDLASGRSVQQYYNDVGRYALSSAERKIALQSVIQAIRGCGKGMAAMHSHVKREKKALPVWVKTALYIHLEKSITKLKVNPKEGINIEKFQQYIENAIKTMESSSSFYTGMAHGDVKLVHTFYDLESQKFALIDPPWIWRSIDRNGIANGLPSRDYCQFIASLTLNRFGYFLQPDQTVFKQELLSKEEANLVVKAFKESYLESGGMVPSEAEEDFFWLWHDLTFVSNYMDDFNKQPEPAPTRLKELVAISLENFKERLK